jgi:Flp pilus assembly pilin Flp
MNGLTHLCTTLYAGGTHLGKRLYEGSISLTTRIATRLQECKGQGTTEYAIIVGVIVVIAIIAVIAFKDKLQELWDSIVQGINKL